MINPPWTLKELVLLTKHYGTIPKLRQLSADMQAVSGITRTVYSIHAKARVLKLSRENGGRKNIKNIGKKTRFNTTNPAPLRDKIMAILASRSNVTISELAVETGTWLSSCFICVEGIVKAGKAHVSGIEKIGRTKRKLYSAGPAPADAPIIEKRQNKPIESRHADPIPRPTLGAWGLTWPVSKSPSNQIPLD